MLVPMLTNREWDEVQPLLRHDIERIKAHRNETGMALRETLEQLDHQACEKFLEITGFNETNPNAIWHHRLSAFGPECPKCGHLFRTAEAAFCANCGSGRAQ